jgi:hypothetical protein
MPERKSAKQKTAIRKHAEIELGHSAYTDNDGIKKKVWLRKQAISGLNRVSVLDLFAGDNLIWSQIETERYYGVEAEKGKGNNLYIDNRKVIPILDLSDFTVIDCDAYGVPYEQIELLFENPTLQKGTIIIFTCITGVLNKICNRAREDYGIYEMYKRTRVLFNRYTDEMFFSMLHSHGVQKVTMYETTKQMKKRYGFFTVP